MTSCLDGEDATVRGNGESLRGPVLGQERRPLDSCVGGAKGRLELPRESSGFASVACSSCEKATPGLSLRSPTFLSPSTRGVAELGETQQRHDHRPSGCHCGCELVTKSRQVCSDRRAAERAQWVSRDGEFIDNQNFVGRGCERATV